ncbi:MAG: RluA family pseudouridine synthase, partial [Lachnospiraceae bacterium]|nr:RluA family pseudouridine synthase [Lachnospiraceae bacterium]
YKYGDKKWNDGYKNKYGIDSQLLSACRLEFPSMEEPFGKLSRKVITAPLPEIFQRLISESRKA